MVQVLTVGDPAVLAGVTEADLELARGETLAAAARNCAPDCLETHKIIHVRTARHHEIYFVLCYSVVMI